MGEYLDFAVALAREAGAIIRENFALGMRKEWKEDETPVTATDLRINRLVIDAVQRQYPDHAVLGEEGDAGPQGEYVWVCDPVDGTVPFSHGVPVCVFALALCRDGEPIAGVVYDPFMDRLFSAEKGGGAFCNGRPIRVNTAPTLRRQLVEAEYYGDGLYAPSVVEGLLSAGAVPLTQMCVMYPAALVASGEFTGAVFHLTKPYDGAPLRVIIGEAGGKMTDIDGKEQRYDRPINGYIISNGLVHDELLRIVQSAKRR